MGLAVPSRSRFPKAARLLKRRDFGFRPFRRFQTENFNFLYSTSGRGRLGISVSKKVLRRSTARNRIRRLVREAFRLNHTRLAHVDLHVVGQPGLKENWSHLKRQDVELLLNRLALRLAPELGAFSGEAKVEPKQSEQR